MKDKPKRSLIKGISWRAVGTADTFFISWLIMGDVMIAVPIALTEIATKILLYFIHERIWNRVNWGRGSSKPAHYRSFAKGVSWRAFGTIDTIIISFFISGHWINSISIGFTEVITKVVLFYLHERLWANIKWGRVF